MDFTPQTRFCEGCHAGFAARSLVPQVVMHAASDEPVARRLQIAGHTLFTNEIEMLRGLLEQGCGWGFCRPIFMRHSGKT